MLGRRGRGCIGGVRVLLNRRKELIFSGKAYEMLGKPVAVKLMFDVQNCQIGVAAEDPNSVTAHELVKRRNGVSRYVQTGGFCDEFLIRNEVTIAFNNIRLEESVMILDLKSCSYAQRRLLADAEDPNQNPLSNMEIKL